MVCICVTIHVGLLSEDRSPLVDPLFIDTDCMDKAMVAP